MSMNLNYIVTPIIGGIIGYTTNWIAIKMLFRPYTEKYFMGIKIPFTPGLIPNERKRIALAMGEVIEQYLLTDEVILNELTSEKVDKIILSFFDEESHLEDGKLNLSLFLQDDEIKQLAGFINNIVWQRINDIINEPSFREKGINIVDEKLTILLKENVINKLAYSNKESLNTLLNQLFKSDEAKDVFYKEVDGLLGSQMPIKDLIGEEWLSQVKQIIQINEPKIKQTINKLIRDEQFADAAKELISTVITNKFGALGAMFVNPDSIYESIAATLGEKLEEANLTEMIFPYLNQIFENKISDYLDEEMKRKTCLQISEKILNNNLINKVQAYILNMDKTIYEWIDTLLDGGTHHSVRLVSEKIYDYLIEYYNASRNKVEEASQLIIKEMLIHPITLTPNNKTIISEKVLAIYHMIIRKYVTKLIASVKLSSIIEKQINSFDIEMFEEVILTIAKKELRAITWLGGLLGFIMSIAILIFNYIK